MGSCLITAKSTNADCNNRLEYKNAINTLTKWWHENVSILPDTEYLELAVDLYNNLFLKMPSVQKMFMSRNIDMHSQALKMLGMFRWIILSSTDSTISDNTLVALHQLGRLHDGLGITLDDYLLAGSIFQETMSKAFGNTYNLRTKWCFNILYEIMVGVMTGKSFNELCNKQNDKLMSLWKQFDDNSMSVKDCLGNEEIMSYLQLFMKERFCIESFLFIDDYKKYKLLFFNNNNNKNAFGEYMKELYIESNSQQQINISGPCRILFYQTLATQNNVYTDNIFDDCYDETMELIQSSVYPKFKQAIKECINSINVEPSSTKIDLGKATNRSLIVKLV